MSNPATPDTPPAGAPEVTIIIPVLDRLEFTRQCLDRIRRHTGDTPTYEVIIVDNASSDGTGSWCEAAARTWPRLRYHRNAVNLGYARANNQGADLARGARLLFLNNDTLVQPGWLSEMLRVADADRLVGVVGIKQLFPYTNVVHHTGIVFADGGVPQHLHPHLDASLPAVNQEREYQAVNGACLLVDRALFLECGGFDDAYVNGYEDVDLCLRVRERGRKVVCCTRAFIYHYGQISEGRTAEDNENLALFQRRWRDRIVVDQASYQLRDGVAGQAPPAPARVRSLADDCVYLADDLSQGSALTWFTANMALALADIGVPVFVRAKRMSETLDAPLRRRLSHAVLDEPPIGGTQIRWSHHWPRHLEVGLAGSLELEFFVINYQFGETTREPWDPWLQSVRGNGRPKLPLSGFCQSVLEQVGVPADQCVIVHPGYSNEIPSVDAPHRRTGPFRFLTVTNSHDLERYNTAAVIDAFSSAFGPADDVELVVKDYGASSGDTTLLKTLAGRSGGPRISYVSAFTDKRSLIQLYKSCDAFVSAHRGEGFAMKILDAMACGLPVITPLFGGPTAYCSPETCFPVEFALAPVGDCLDARELAISNRPLWAEVDRTSLEAQLRRVHEDRVAARAVAARGEHHVLGSYSWEGSARQLLEAAQAFRDRLPGAHRSPAPPPPAAYASPYWLGIRVSVVIPTRDRKAKLLKCLEALAAQSILLQEFEVLVIDDGSTDGTAEVLTENAFPFSIRYFRQNGEGAGAARNVGIEHAVGELILFIGDDIYASERLLEEHLLAHAAHPSPGTAILGHVDWPDTFAPNAVMEYVCGEGMLQSAYGYIATAPDLDHRFFYTSNVSLRRHFLLEAAGRGPVFDPAFRRAAFEDSELAYRLLPHGLTIRYAPAARAVHDHWMDLESFAERERAAGQMAVVFYRKHPGHDDHLQVCWIADLVEPSRRLCDEPEVLRQLEVLDRQTDALLWATEASLEQLSGPGGPAILVPARPAHGLRPALQQVLKTVFDVARTRGKVQEWFATVDDEMLIRAAQTLAAVSRKVEFLDGQALGQHGVPAHSPGGWVPEGSIPRGAWPAARAAGWRTSLRRLAARPAVASRLSQLDRAIAVRLQAPGRQAWLQRYRDLRGRFRRLLVGTP